MGHRGSRCARDGVQHAGVHLLTAVGRRVSLLRRSGGKRPHGRRCRPANRRDVTGSEAAGFCWREGGGAGAARACENVRGRLNV